MEARNDNCTSGCRTRDHESYGQCLRSKRAAVMGLESTGNDYTTQKKWDRDLDEYRKVRAEGIQPASTNRQSVEDAKILSDVAGQAYQA